MRAFFYVVICTAWAQMMLADVKADKKRPTEVGRRDIGARVRSPVCAPGSDL